MTTFLASLGARLTRFELDSNGALRRRDDLDLASPIHYAWPHPRLRLLYVASSGRWFTPRDDGHMLSVVEIPDHGPMRQRGPSIPLRSRPIHLTLDRDGAHVISLFNDPPGAQVHALDADGTVTHEVEQAAALDFGIYPHQVRVSPCNRFVIVVARGNNAAAGRKEDPGGLRLFSFEGGRLAPRQTVAPGGGLGFGPRHIDFHPALPCLYVSLERQSQLQVFDFRDGVIGAEPRQTVSTLAPGKAPQYQQFGGAVHVDPAGAFVFVVNRDDPHPGKEASHLSGDNTMAAFAIDPTTGAVSSPAHSELDAFHVRTFSLHPPFLVAAAQADVTLPDADRVTPASLGVFRIEADGRLGFVHRTPAPTGESMLFWCGFPRAYGATWP